MFIKKFKDLFTGNSISGNKNKINPLFEWMYSLHPGMNIQLSFTVEDNVSEVDIKTEEDLFHLLDKGVLKYVGVDIYISRDQQFFKMVSELYNRLKIYKYITNTVQKKELDASKFYSSEGNKILTIERWISEKIDSYFKENTYYKLDDFYYQVEMMDIPYIVFQPIREVVYQNMRRKVFIRVPLKVGSKLEWSAQKYHKRAISEISHSEWLDCNKKIWVWLLKKIFKIEK